VTVVDSPPTAGRSRGLVWLGVACGFLLLPYLALAAFAHPIADDFTYAFDTQRDGLWAAYRAQYLSWNGRYASNVFELAGPMVWRALTLYRLVAASMIVGTAAAAYLVVRALTRGAWSRTHAAAAAVVFTALFIATVPSLGESVYWYTSTVTYQLSAILAAIQAAMVIDVLADADDVRRRARLTIAVVLLPAVVGMNEVAMMLMISFYAVLFAVAIVEARPRVVAVARLMLAIAIVSGVVVWIAPGNSVRGAMYPVRHELLRSLALTAMQTIRFGAAWTTMGPLLLASFLFLPLAAQIARRAPVFRTITPLDAAALAAGAWLTIPIATFPAYWSTGVLGQHRTTSVAYFVFLLLWFVALTALVAVGRLPTPAASPGDRRVRAAAVLLFAASLAFTHNGYVVAVDVGYGRPAAFDREMTARYAALRACAATPQTPCVLSSLSTRPDAFYVIDVSPEPENWINDAYRYYFRTGPVIGKARP
jgi:hypothetical protein